MYTHSIDTIYLSLRAQVAEGTFFMKSPVVETDVIKRDAHIILAQVNFSGYREGEEEGGRNFSFP